MAKKREKTNQKSTGRSSTKIAKKPVAKKTVSTKPKSTTTSKAKQSVGQTKQQKPSTKQEKKKIAEAPVIPLGDLEKATISDVKLEEQFITFSFKVANEGKKLIDRGNNAEGKPYGKARYITGTVHYSRNNKHTQITVNRFNDFTKQQKKDIIAFGVKQTNTIKNNERAELKKQREAEREKIKIEKAKAKAEKKKATPAKKPVAKKPATTKKPVAKKPVAKKPAVKKAVKTAKKPVVKKPVIAKKKIKVPVK